MAKDFDDDIALIMRSAKGFRERPFESPSWAAWSEKGFFYIDPVIIRRLERESALVGQGRHGPMTKEEVDELWPEMDEKLEQQHLVWQAWQSGEKLYSSQVLHRQTGTKTSYKQWLRTKRIPEMLSFQEYWFLSEYLRATGSAAKYLVPDNFEHFAPVRKGPSRTRKSKVGNTYGKWVLMELVSESETVRPLYYKAMCQACGHTIEKFNYSRVGQPCGNCKRIEKVFKITSEPKPEDAETVVNLASPITVWQVKSGWIAQAERPKTAKAKIVFNQLGKVASLERLSGWDSSDDPEAFTTRAEPPQEEELSAYAKSIKTLDIPEF